MIDLPPSSEKQEDSPPAPREDVIPLLHGAKEFIRANDNNEVLLDIFKNNIDVDRLEREKRLLTGWTQAIGYRRPEIAVGGYGYSADETAAAAITMKRARAFWAHGPRLAEDTADLEAWLTVVSHPEFFQLADRSSLPPSIPQDRISEGFSRLTGEEFYKAVVHVTEDNDTDYPISIARRMHALAVADEKDDVHPTLKQLGRAFIRKVTNVTNQSSLQVKVGDSSTVNEVANPIKALMLEVAKLQESRANINIPTPSAALARLEFLNVNSQSGPLLKGLLPAIQHGLQQNEPERKRWAARRESLDFVRGASRLLFSTIGFTASEEGLNSVNARKMQGYLSKVNSYHGRQLTPTRKSLIALANQVTPALKNALGDDFPLLDEQVTFDTYLAIDRIFTFMEYEAEINEKEEVQGIIASAAEASLLLADYGLKEIITIERPSTSQPPASLFENETNRKTRRRKLYDIRRAGYGTLS